MRTGSIAKETAWTELEELARLYGVEVAYRDVTGQRQEASPQALLAVLSILGAPVAAWDDVADALRQRRQAQWRRCLEPVCVAWDGGPAEITLRLPANAARGSFVCDVHHENGRRRRWSGRLEEAPDRESAVVEGVGYVAKRIQLPERTPLGYHRLTLELNGRRLEALLLSAPTRAYSPQGRGWERSWGVFLPLYALHSAQSWGAGDFTDLCGLLEWVREQGGGFVGTLPLLPAFLDEPYEVSPYSPVSRLFWNEFYLDVYDIPELANSPAARALLESAAQAELRALRSGPLVDYRRQMRLKRNVLEELVCSFFANPSDRLAAFQHYAAAHPYVDNYARFRAVVDRRRTPWTEWPAPLRDGAIRAGDYDEHARRYHLYVQWLAEKQLQAVAHRSQQTGAGLYLDLPLGVNAHGYDIWRERQAFAVGVAGGCPPDPVFPKGQNWGFTPMHPEGMRRNGYRYVRAFAEHHLRFAEILRIDHMPSFHRLFWIPPGLEARDGAYVRYPAEELYAVFCLESHRHRTMLIGEDLGTVPPEVPQAMMRHNFHRMYVVQNELKPDREMALADPPAASVASVNTHDMPPFAAYWEGRDIGERLETGLLTQEQFWEDEQTRRKLREALLRFLEAEGRLHGEAGAYDVFQACLARLRDSAARMLLVNLEDLWREVHSQNIPSTAYESPNWRRKARYSFEEFRRREEVLNALRQLNEAIPAKQQAHSGRRPPPK